jgi:hypothetical protein
MFFLDGKPCGLAVQPCGLAVQPDRILFCRRWKQQNFSLVFAHIFQTTRRYSPEYYNLKVLTIGVVCCAKFVIWKVLIFSNILHITHSGKTFSAPYHICH